MDEGGSSTSRQALHLFELGIGVVSGGHGGVGSVNGWFEGG
jgi:hypothetical protein